MTNIWSKIGEFIGVLLVIVIVFSVIVNIVYPHKDKYIEYPCEAGVMQPDAC